MAAQMRRLLELSAMPGTTIQVLPAIAHPATASELIIADNNAAYAEHLAAGGVYTEAETCPYPRGLGSWPAFGKPVSSLVRTCLTRELFSHTQPYRAIPNPATPDPMAP
jgi:hypothetical protein